MRGRSVYMIAVLWLVLSGTGAAQDKGRVGPKADTETVITTFHVKEGKEAEFARVLDRAWLTYRQLGMVLEQPNLVVRGTEASGKTYFIEIFTWKDHEVPDHAPPAVLTIWAQMEALCERRDGHRGIEFTEVQIVTPKK